MALRLRRQKKPKIKDFVNQFGFGKNY